MNEGILLLSVLLCITIYKVIDLALNRHERYKALQKLEGEQLIEYLGKTEPRSSQDLLKASLWWLMRIASVLIGVGIAFLQTIWIAQLPKSRISNTPEMVAFGVMMLCGALFLMIELLIERKVRK